MIPFTCPCCEVDRPPHRDGCTFHSDCPSEAETFDEVSALRAEVARLREERRWIPVGERLPEVDSEVLVAWSYEEDKEQVVSQAWRNHLGKFVSLEDIEFFGVTHWMPLPAPPKGGEVE